MPKGNSRDGLRVRTGTRNPLPAVLCHCDVALTDGREAECIRCGHLIELPEVRLVYSDRPSRTLGRLHVPANVIHHVQSLAA